MSAGQVGVVLAVLIVVSALLWRPFLNGLVTLEFDIFSRSRFVEYDPSRPELGYPIQMAGAREAFAAGLYSRPPFDSNGIPVTDYTWTRQVGIRRGRHTNPGRVALYALQGCFLPWLASGSAAALQDLRRQAEWLCQHQTQAGEYVYAFGHARFGKRAGWISAWAQGLAVSSLVRSYLIFCEPAYLVAARRAAAPMLRRVQDGGVLWIDDSGYWLEEVPEDSPSHILNGFITAWHGLVDLEAVSPNPEVTRVRSLCAETLRRHAASYGEGGPLLYDLKRRVPATLGYPRLQVEQMRSLAFLTGDRRFDHIADDWERRFCRPRSSATAYRWSRAAMWALYFRQAQCRLALRSGAWGNGGQAEVTNYKGR